MMLRIAFFFLLLAAAPVGAVQPDEILADPTLENRARALSRDLRCLVCQNQSIDDSNAPLARDLRVIVRERLTAGDSDGQVLDFVTARYGDYVLLRTPFKASTYLLWLGPLVLLLLGIAAVAAFFAKRRRVNASAATPLTADESRRLERLLEADGPR
jgi:cytochrome c-type biogenesis protein CcmH